MDMKIIHMNIVVILLLTGIADTGKLCSQPKPQTASTYLYNDSHFHLTNYIQEGITATQFLEIMGDKVGRSALFGIPLQQQWSYQNSGSANGPTYYLQSDAPLYYYSFTDAYIAMQYKSLTPDQQ